MSTEQTVNTNNTDRRSFIHKVGKAGLTLGAGALLTAYASRDAEAQTASYTVPSGEIARAFQSIASDEKNHVAFLITAITASGGTPRPAPTFYEPSVIKPAASVLKFVQDSAALENTGTGAYLAATPLAVVTAVPLGLQAAAEIAIVEGRHAGFLNSLLGRTLLTDPNQADSVAPSPNVEVAQGPDMVYARAAPFTGTVAADAATANGTGTSLNGGPALPTDATIGSATYIDILNYALFLEYLEMTFYATNVPHFFK